MDAMVCGILQLCVYMFLLRLNQHTCLFSGVRGLPGVIGDFGDTGSMGNGGRLGDTGYTGPQGPVGAAGKIVDYRRLMSPPYCVDYP